MLNLDALRPRSRCQYLLCVLGLCLIGIGMLSAPADGPTKNEFAHKPDGNSELDQSGPPWRHGPSPARFTIIEYADLECPHCQTYTPILLHWVSNQFDVNLQWHHLPLDGHEPAASKQAAFTECVGQEHGHAAFWHAIEWIYEQTRTRGKGVPDLNTYPGMTPTLQACMRRDDAMNIVQTQAQEAMASGISATPTLRLVNNETNANMVLTGPMSGDELLSALDLLSTPSHREEPINAQ